jgi:hypothetical protein
LPETREIRLDTRGAGKHRIFTHNLASQLPELRRETETQSASIVIVQVYHANAARVEPTAGEARELDA